MITYPVGCQGPTGCRVLVGQSWSFFGKLSVISLQNHRSGFNSCTIHSTKHGHRKINYDEFANIKMEVCFASITMRFGLK